jgi:peptidoglycan/xylan/chitin deacetylase (PgdA/CDA1 family)
MTSERPLISFTFDDFPKTALFTAGVMLESLGMSATFYAAAGLMGSTTGVGAIFDEGGLRTLIEHGHQLASHTYSHISARNTRLSAYYEEVKKGNRRSQDTLQIVSE